MTGPESDTSAPISTQNQREYPHVYYLTMAYEAVNTRHAIINAIEQDYPGEKTIVLIDQELNTKQITSSLINVVHLCVQGKWPALWLAKLELFIRAVSGVNPSGKVAVWWDEDDMFEMNYTRYALEPMMQDNTVVGTWTDKTYYVKKGEIVSSTYPRSNGTLAVKIDALKEVVPQVRKTHPEGHRIKRGMTLTVDPTLVKMLGDRYGDKMMDHIGMRYYFLRSGGNGGPRRKGTGVNIDE